ncbi:hypothetical protein M426DRAFT_10513 [Hypoxylon sp. CI-4A]|nr:hypothetical protein M426DRAFT_10513 [Hypoxylon sp. CI-4A]
MIDTAVGTSGRTPLHLAVVAGAASAVGMLLNYGALPHIRDKYGNDAFGIATRHAAELVDANPPRLDDHVDIMTLLTKMTRTNYPMQKCKCVVEVACMESDPSLLRQLTHRGLEPNQRFKNSPLLHLAIQHRNSAAARLLTVKKAPVDETNADGVDAVTAALSAGDAELARYMVRDGQFARKANKARAEEIVDLE